MPCASTVILHSLRSIGEVAYGTSTLAANLESDYRGDLNSMLDMWSIQRLACYQLAQDSFTLTASAASTTIGSSATFATDRPVKIVSGRIRDSSNIDYELKIISFEEYNRIAVKNVNSPYPRYLAYDHAFDASGYGKIWLYERPSTTNTLIIESWKALTRFSSATHNVLLPPGYEDALWSNFAIRAAAGYRAVPPEVVLIAKESKAAIKSLNIPDMLMRLDDAVVGRRRAGNIISGA